MAFVQLNGSSSTVSTANGSGNPAGSVMKWQERHAEDVSLGELFCGDN
jgi:hypothetical protein